MFWNLWIMINIFASQIMTYKSQPFDMPSLFCVFCCGGEINEIHY
ncbi:hypothetical protein M758_4G032800 [Ceratodon purpureus]|uniref:Uncharacterized protein n=1 Tax=Ceratodon purpureus TaxID=3225 RepID=A0A8T0I566_CERPU|nr:hypothetical protein KC19_4G036100 [Ceratodon purpureus]KAG0618016.1 hypothetical protein M758_4G032800 [Ceratodon purpureus]